ncbi:hypothetical protein B0H13DRAFT_2288289, partial [Mycena leptocephala]
VLPDTLQKGRLELRLWLRIPRIVGHVCCREFSRRWRVSIWISRPSERVSERRVCGQSGLFWPASRQIRAAAQIFHSCVQSFFCLCQTLRFRCVVAPHDWTLLRCSALVRARLGRTNQHRRYKCCVAPPVIIIFLTLYPPL